MSGQRVKKMAVFYACSARLAYLVETYRHLPTYVAGRPLLVTPHNTLLNGEGITFARIPKVRGREDSSSTKFVPNSC